MIMEERGSNGNCAIGWNLTILTNGIYLSYLQHEQDVTQGQFLSRVQLVWIQFPSPKLVTSLRLKHPVCLIIYP